MPSYPTLLAALAIAALVASWYLAPLAWARVLKAFARRAAGMRCREGTVEGVRWSWLEGGDGPSLVLLHGFGAEADHWLGVAAALRRRFRVLAPDLPGFGNSEPAGTLDFEIHEQSRRLGQWLEGRRVGSCLLAGNSMGGWIAADYAARHPERVKGLWLMDPLGVQSSESSELLAALERDGSNPFSVRTGADYRRLARLMHHRRPHLPWPLVQHGARSLRRLEPDLDRMSEEIMEGSRPIESLAPALVMPVLVQWGEADRAVDASGAVILQNLLPRARAVVQKDVGHLPMLESPAQSARLFLDFCRSEGLVDTDPAPARGL